MTENVGGRLAGARTAATGTTGTGATATGTTRTGTTGAGATGTGTTGGAARLDAAPLAPLRPAAREALLAALDDGWADPSRLHGDGRRARALLDTAREQIAGVLGARPDEVFFAASGPAAAQDALLGTALSRRRVGAGAVVSAVEHAAILHAADWLGDRRNVPVSATGVVRLDEFAAAVAAPGVAVAALQLANGEVGALQPVEAAAAACTAAGVPLLVDLSAALGHVPVAGVPADHLVVDGRGVGGPPGVGVRVTRTGVRWRRPGPPVAAPEPLPLILATAAALAAAESERATLAAGHATLTRRLRAELPRLVPDLLVAGPDDEAARLPHVLTVSALYVDGEALVTALDRLGVAAASGSACTAETVEPSHVLAAMGFLTQGNLRVTLGRDAGDADVDALLAALPDVVARIRADAGVAGL